MMRRFAILLHTGQGQDHYDLLLEPPAVSPDAALATWQLDESLVTMAIGESQRGQKLPDHRRVYLEYEGPVSEGRGEVQRVAAGEYTLLEQHDGMWRIKLPAVAASAIFRLHRDGEATSNAWIVTRET